LAHFGVFQLSGLPYVLRHCAGGMDPTYVGKQFYEQALMETDRSRLPVLIRAAWTAIDVGMEQLPSDSHAWLEKRQAISDALSGLRILKQESDFDSHPILKKKNFSAGVP
jgi:hypothetical protein